MVKNSTDAVNLIKIDTKLTLTKIETKLILVLIEIETKLCEFAKKLLNNQIIYNYKLYITNYIQL